MDKRPYVRRAPTKKCARCDNRVLRADLCRACTKGSGNGPMQEPPLPGFVRLADIPVPRPDPWAQSGSFEPDLYSEKEQYLNLRGVAGVDPPPKRGLNFRK